MTTQKDITEAAVSAGLAGRPLEIHASLSSFGHVDGGADAVIDGLLDADCTVLVPTFTTRTNLLSPDLVPSFMRPERNAEEIAFNGSPASAAAFDIDSPVINAAMGAVSAAVVARPSRFRGDHPLNSFAAVGPMARQIVSGQTGKNVYAPLFELAALNGAVVMMGTALDKMTLIHAAEEQAGRNLFVQWARRQNGSIEAVRVGSCSDGFERLEFALCPYEQTVTVGESHWRIYDAEPTLTTATRVIREDPEVTRCDRPGCAWCRDAIPGGPIFQ